MYVRLICFYANVCADADQEPAVRLEDIRDRLIQGNGQTYGKLSQ